jgi:hypothetical protein
MVGTGPSCCPFVLMRLRVLSVLVSATSTHQNICVGGARSLAQRQHLLNNSNGVAGGALHEGTPEQLPQYKSFSVHCGTRQVCRKTPSLSDHSASTRSYV